MSHQKILIVEDERALGLALAATVRQAGATGEIAPSAALARKQLKSAQDSFAAMVLDIGLPDENGLEFLASLPETMRPPTIVITAHGEIENTISARKLGVTDFLTKPLDFSKFTTALKRVLSQRPEAAKEQRASGPFIGAAPSMRSVFQHIAHACASNDPVLISGETGTGKSTAASLIFRNGQQADGPLEVVRPSAIDQPGEIGKAWERSKGGGLILEDIDFLDSASQIELVRRLEENGPDAPRILATSSPNLHTAVKESRLRSDLFYRLQVLEVKLPALRNRAEDIPALFDYFLGMLESGRNISVTTAAGEILRGYGWPGNLRELKNVASYALTVSSSATRLDQLHLPSHLTDSEALVERSTASDFEKELDRWIEERVPNSKANPMPAYRDLADGLERMLIHQLLLRFDGKLARLAKAMGANRTTLRKKMQPPAGSDSQESCGS